MSVDLPDFLESGEIARLIPVAHAGQKERHAVSVLLATMTVVRPFAQAVLETIDRQMGSMSSLQCFTEVVFKEPPDGTNCRPDGLLIIRTPRSEWRALVEAKLGAAKIEPSQLATYCRLARAKELDAIITLSNEFAPIPSHPPYPMPPDLRGKVELFHWSWQRLVTLAILLLSGSDPFDQEQQFILKEMLRYFTHENVDVRGFHQMNPEWPSLVSKIFAGAELGKHDADNIEKTVRAWHQEQQDLCLILCRELRVPVSLIMSRQHKQDQQARIADDAAELVSNKRLHAIFDVPNLAGPLHVAVNMMRRNVVCSMSVAAPEDRQKYKSRLNWLLRQIPQDADASTVVHIHWRNGGKTFAPLAQLRANPEAGDIGRPGTVPKQFDVATVTDLERRFSGTKTFIDGLEAAVPRFYETVARHISPWYPAPVPGPPTNGQKEDIAATVEGLDGPSPRPMRVVQQGVVEGRRYSIFENGSIQIETATGTKWFKDFAALREFDLTNRGSRSG
jgi:hypothetical protein